jgi:multiple sugar transport system permease protein
MSIEELEEPATLSAMPQPASTADTLADAVSRRVARAIPSGSSPRARRNLFAALLFLAPNLIGFAAFTLFPVVFSFVMAFTNWSIKPAVQFQFVGLRNFTDLLGARPNSGHSGDPALLAVYVLCALATFAGLITALMAMMASWRGTRLGGALLAAGGVAMFGMGLAGRDQNLVLAGLVAGLGGAAMARKPAADGSLVGVGALPGLLLTLGVAGLWLLQPQLAKFYEPRDLYFWQFLYNTVYLMLGIPLSIAGSLALALLLSADLPIGGARNRVIGTLVCCIIGAALGGAIWLLGNPNAGLIVMLLWGIIALGFAGNIVAYRTIFYLPTFTAGVALMILWQALYNPETGPINVGLNALIHALHIHATPPQWLADVAWAKPALIAMGVWTSIGGTNMLLYLAGLSNVPKELLEAADIDGAGSWQKFWNVTWPQLAPTTFFISIMSIIGGLQGGFEQARVMTNGGPAGSTTTLAYYIYNKAFLDLDMGYAAAISWVLFGIVFIATAINWKFGKGLEVD